MAKRQAIKGGEVGANGEWYQGGQFIATCEETIKGSRPEKKTTRKQQYEPFKWSIAPVDGQIALMSKYGQTWDWPTWRSTGTMKVVDGLNVEYFGAAYLSECAAAAERWNNGERWE